MWGFTLLAEVVLMTGRNLFFFRITGTGIVCVIEFSTYSQGCIYARAKGAWAQGGKCPGAAYQKKIEIEVWYAEKKAVHETEI
jgi:hypothetical protein